MLAAVSGGERKKIKAKIDALTHAPGQQGKSLIGELQRYRSIRAAGRYRVIFFIEVESSRVFIVAIGIRREGDRKDVYETAKRLLNSGTLGP
jgi:mRNA interferase RelE/StbE